MRHGLSSFLVVLEQLQAEAGSSYKAVLRVGHGCSESPVKAPAALLDVRPAAPAAAAVHQH